MKSLEERKAILDKEIFKHVNHGWRLVHQSDTKCLLEKKRKPKGCLLAFLLLLLIIPGIIYLLMNKGKSTLMIEVTPKGDVTITTTGLSIFERQELESY
ncbi:MAG: hypothetical protein RBT38_10780 [Bacteroidales bacterium]|jgi:hypothetical protein|nr:hypothetical protein [Bacteroidales bacterium]